MRRAVEATVEKGVTAALLTGMQALGTKISTGSIVGTILGSLGIEVIKKAPVIPGMAVEVVKAMGYQGFERGLKQGRELATIAVTNEFHDLVATASLPQLAGIFWDLTSQNPLAAAVRKAFILSISAYGAYRSAQFLIRYSAFKHLIERENDTIYAECTSKLHEMLINGRITVVQYNDLLRSMNFMISSNELKAFFVELHDYKKFN